MPQINLRNFSFEESIYKSSIDTKSAKLPKVSYLSPVRGWDETTLGKIFPRLDIDKSIAHSLVPKIRGNSKVFSPLIYRQTLHQVLKKLESMPEGEFQEIISLLGHEKEKQELFIFYQNSLFAA